LAGKGIKDTLLEPIITNTASSVDTYLTGIIAINKHKTSTINSYVDHALTAAQQACANVKLFQQIAFVILNKVY
jgi:heme oxygenase